MGNKHLPSVGGCLAVACAEHTANLDANDKLRLFLCYCATHPEKLDATKRSHWATLARLHESDMAAVTNLAFLGVPVMKPGGQQGAMDDAE
jgi:hypothetical protein